MFEVFFDGSFPVSQSGKHSKSVVMGSGYGRGILFASYHPMIRGSANTAIFNIQLSAAPTVWRMNACVSIRLARNEESPFLLTKGFNPHAKTSKKKNTTVQRLKKTIRVQLA